MSSGASIMVCVRVRPFNKREKEIKCDCTVTMPDGHKKGESVVALDPASGQMKNYTFDRAYWSFDEHFSPLVSQADVFDDLGEIMLSTCFSGTITYFYLINDNATILEKFLILTSHNSSGRTIAVEF